MHTVSTLEEIKKWLQEKVLTEVALQAPEARGEVSAYQLAEPVVHIGWVPPNGIIEQGEDIRIPCLVVGIDEVNSDSDSTEFKVQLTAVVYDPGHQEYPEQKTRLQLTPNFDGYQTLLNLLDRVRAAILRRGGISKQFELLGAIKLKTYEEQPWPYWYGYLAFTLSGEAYPQLSYAKYLE